MSDNDAGGGDRPGGDRGIRCGDCNGGHFYTLRTTKLPGGRILRERQCRNCGRRIRTYERAFGS